MIKKICDSCGNDALYTMEIYDTYKKPLNLDLCEKCYNKLTTMIKDYLKYGRTARELVLSCIDGMKYTE